MDSIKKTGIIAGAIVGGIVGGSISLIGKLSKVKAVDDIGSSITSSSILTGELTGELASGAVDAVSGGVTKKPYKTREGLNDLKRGGKRVVGNFVENVRRTVDNSLEIAVGVKSMDGEKIKDGVKKLAKFAAVGAITVGAIKMTDSDNDNA